jgi:hypothetical protein
MKSITHWRSEGAGFALDVVNSGGNSGASAEVVGNCIIVTTGALADTETCTVDTPFSFEIVDAMVRCDEAAANATIQIKNNATAVTDAMGSATEDEIARMTTLDDDASLFGAGDNDLVITSASGTGDGSHVVFIYFK